MVCIVRFSLTFYRFCKIGIADSYFLLNFCCSFRYPDLVHEGNISSPIVMYESCESTCLDELAIRDA